ncbi:MAG TPA: GNAT family N-acetyltransferase [Anaerolineaceae bacterium]|nr:GNAT family N-acetyltransferase [Anaerolineaceae bacterium]HPN52094.1 GNAT family N-acetyltransferase [Anaerolineaceae bacterium]
MDIEIRKATPDDYADVCELLHEIDTYHCENEPQIFQPNSGPVREREYYLSRLADESVGFFLAAADGQAAGLVHLFVRETPPLPILVPRFFAVVECLVVKKTFQRRGIGRMLMEYGQAWAKTKGAAAIELNVCAFNSTAIELYEALGYRTLSQKMSHDLD